MQIAIAHHQLSLKGGMETYLLNLIAGFDKQKDKVTLLIYKKNTTQIEIACSVYRKNLSWLPRTLRKYWFGSRLHKDRQLQSKDLKISLMRAFYQDVIICGGTHLGFLAHTQKRPSYMDKLEVSFERKSYHSSSFIVAHSNLLKEELVTSYNIDPKKILMCYPPIDHKRFNQSLRDKREVLRKKFGFHPDKKIILFPSTGHKRKGFYALVDAFKYLPQNEYELVIAGDPPQVPSDNIKYLGFVEDMASLYTAVDMTILPSYYEPFGLVVMESLACGTPVIVSPFVGAKDLITENEGIILNDLLPETISSAILAGSNRSYFITPNYIERHHLTVDAHISQLKKMLIRDPSSLSG